MMRLVGVAEVEEEQWPVVRRQIVSIVLGLGGDDALHAFWRVTQPGSFATSPGTTVFCYISLMLALPGYFCSFVPKVGGLFVGVICKNHVGAGSSDQKSPTRRRNTCDQYSRHQRRG